MAFRDTRRMANGSHDRQSARSEPFYAYRRVGWPYNLRIEENG